MAYFYLGTFSKKGNARLAAFLTVEEAWQAAIHAWPGRPLPCRESALAWLRADTTEKQALRYLKQAEKMADLAASA